MYWIFLVLFLIAVLVPDIIRRDFYFLSETRMEEINIFLLGIVAFFVFIRNERQIYLQKKDKEKDLKKINQTVKDLVESYSYIGEVNRKMDILMNIALGLADSSNIDKDREKEIYGSIISASNFLMKAEYTTLKFVNLATKKVEKSFSINHENIPVKNTDLMAMQEDVNVKKIGNCLIICSHQKINNTKSYLIICGYNEEEEASPKNMEILKVFASQAIFLYSYVKKFVSIPPCK